MGALRLYKELMVAHAVDKPDTSLIFVTSEVRLLTDFVSLTLMKHYHLYQYCLHNSREVDVMRVQVAVEEPLAPLDLSRAKLFEEPIEEGIYGADPQIPVGERIDDAGHV